MSKQGAANKSASKESADIAKSADESSLDLNEVRRLIGTLADDSPSDDDENSLDSPRRNVLYSASVDEGRAFQKSYLSLPTPQQPIQRPAANINPKK